MSRFFRDFWIDARNGQRLYLARIKNTDTGVVRFQSLAKGDNKKSMGGETTDPVEAVKWFLAGESLRFGNETTENNRYELHGGNVLSFGMSPDLWLKVR